MIVLKDILFSRPQAVRLNENYKRGCQKIEDLTLRMDTRLDARLDTSFRAKSTVMHSSVDFAICRVFKGIAPNVAPKKVIFWQIAANHPQTMINHHKMN